MAPERISRLIDRAVAEISAHADELTRLDQAIGDGDHGINMKRGFDAIGAERDKLVGLALGPALQQAGMILVMKVGGASGPLYGSLLMAMGKAAPAEGESLDGVRAMLAAGVEAVKKRGKAEAGEKTMLDVLIPVQEALASADDGDLPDLLEVMRSTSDQALEATRPLKATKGRASFLGERSIGHLDPGASSSRLLVHTACDVMAEDT
jgi:dihydroxyacetone kinase-like protein